MFDSTPTGALTYNVPSGATSIPGSLASSPLTTTGVPNAAAAATPSTRGVSAAAEAAASVPRPASSRRVRGRRERMGTPPLSDVYVPNGRAGQSSRPGHDTVRTAAAEPDGRLDSASGASAPATPPVSNRGVTRASRDPAGDQGQPAVGATQRHWTALDTTRHH